jgi:glycosyltransferase involved in cell wall biosynthesis
MQKEVAILIPCYNEEKRLPVDEIYHFVKNSGKVRLFLVDDGSRDNTGEIIKGLANEDPQNISVILYNENQGKAETIRKSMIQLAKTNNFKYIGFFDADLSTPLYEIDNFMKIFTTNPNLVLVMGSRVKRLGASITRSWKRHVMGRIFASAISQILQIPVYDSQCGAKIIRSEIAEKIFEKRFISKWLFDMEMIGRIILHLGYARALEAVYESPLNYWADDGDSRIRIKEVFKFPFELLKIKREYYRKIKKSKNKSSAHG